MVKDWLFVGARFCISTSVLLLVGARSITGWWVAHGLTTSGHGRWIGAGNSATGSRSVRRRRRGGCLLFEHGPVKRIIILMIQRAEEDTEQLPQVHVVRSLLKSKSSGSGNIIYVRATFILFWCYYTTSEGFSVRILSDWLSKTINWTLDHMDFF